MIKRILPHVCLILSLVTLTFLILDQFNPTIFGKPFFHVTLLIFCITTAVASVIFALDSRKN